ncbi:hypothetical protein fHeYen801_021 [Yersinia phage fHe-Yen8-01]|nr:hypothetical protein fHeYen801_021 [Yersinia phage fHe-Yen8-01]
MTNEFEQPMPTYRLAETHHSDDLEKVATRELGDANRWIELVWLNSLVFPYLTDDETQATDGVLLTGSLIRVPAPAGLYSDKTDYDQIFERDVKMNNRRMQAENGDLAIVSGIPNLSQQLNHRIRTPMGQLVRHPQYGCRVFSLFGKVTGPLKTILAAEYVKVAIKGDYRVARVDSVKATTNGDATSVRADLQAIAGAALDLSIPDL